MTARTPTQTETVPASQAPNSASDGAVSSTICGLVERAGRDWAGQFGAGSASELRARYEARLSLPEPKAPEEVELDFSELRVSLEREHYRRYGAAALAAELTDERERDAALTDDAALVRYEAKWRRRLCKLQQAHPARWRVPGLSEEEVRDILTLRLLEVMKTEPSELARHQRAGKEWGLRCLQQHLGTLRRRFRLNATPTDFDQTTLAGNGSTQEERWLELEGERVMQLAQARAELGLSRSQRQWLAALQRSAEAGAFFVSSEALNLSAASRELGKNRSSAQRAYREIQGRFRRELNRAG